MATEDEFQEHQETCRACRDNPNTPCALGDELRNAPPAPDGDDEEE